ncbi:MAG: hypothetical protein LLF98_11075 [Clostridium sp.]|uniref:hypothetical protein n=1 Tax=Clostridium sp. TaxID=1506 RepID=UPI0025C125E4|nr:hypothetical protein [Clostridium sp.]MCE5221771.1 hypothetical protein [Clostridium sp.]
MSTKKVSNNTNLQNSSKEKSSNVYPPKMRTDYTPSDESVESATGVDFPINMPNPAVDPIVSQNISTAEFDYTQDMFPSDDSGL